MIELTPVGLDAAGGADEDGRVTADAHGLVQALEPRQPRPSRFVRQVVIPALTILAAVVGTIGMQGAWCATMAGYDANVDGVRNPQDVALYLNLKEILRQVQERVPAGATVFVPWAADPADATSLMWSMHLNEIALMAGHPLTGADRAAYWLSVVQQGGRATLVVQPRTGR